MNTTKTNKYITLSESEINAIAKAIASSYVYHFDCCNRGEFFNEQYVEFELKEIAAWRQLAEEFDMLEYEYDQLLGIDVYADCIHDYDSGQLINPQVIGVDEILFYDEDDNIINVYIAPESLRAIERTANGKSIEVEGYNHDYNQYYDWYN